MNDTAFKVWANDDEITDLQSLKREKDKLDEALFSDPEKNKQLMAWFFKKTRELKIETRAKTVIDALFQGDFSSFSEVEQFFEESKVYPCFRTLEVAPDVDYLEGEDGPEEYLKSAKALTQSLPENKKIAAAARIAVNAMMLATIPKELPPKLRSAMLKPFQSHGGLGDPVDVRDMELPFGWDHLNPGKKPCLRILRNPAVYPVKLTLKNGQRVLGHIWVPAHSSLAVLQVGQYVTGVKGGLCVNGDYAACLEGEQIKKHRISRGYDTCQSLAEPQSLRDYALDDRGRAHLLEGQNARVWDDQVRKSFSGIIGIYAMDCVWVVHREDGSTDSNLRELRQKDVIAIAQDEEDILLLTRKGQVHSLSGSIDTPEGFWQCMMKRFRELPEEAAERLVYQGHEILRTKDGSMVCRPAESRGA